MAKIHEQHKKHKPADNHDQAAAPGAEKTPEDVDKAESTHHRQSSPHHKKSILGRLKSTDNQALIANCISAVMLAATIILALFTIGLFNKTTIQADSAIKSADAAKISADAAKLSAQLQKQALDSQISAKKQSDTSDARRERREQKLFELQKQSYSLNAKDNNDRFKRDTASLNIQIKGLKQSQEQFTKQNEPYLKIVVDSVFVNFNLLHFGYTIFNLTNTPVRIIDEQTAAAILPYKPFKDVPFTQTFDGVLYVVKESPRPKIATIKYATPGQITLTMKGDYSIYWRAKFEYINEITDEKRLYIIQVKITMIRGVNPPYQSFTENRNISEIANR